MCVELPYVSRFTGVHKESIAEGKSHGQCMWGGFQCEEKSLTKQPTKLLAILKSKQDPGLDDFMVGSTCVSEEGDKSNSRKEEMTVAGVKVVTSKYKDSSKESRSSVEWLVINQHIKMSWRKADESYKKEENSRMRQNQGVLQICRRTEINPGPCTFACRKKCDTWAVAVETRYRWWEHEKRLVQEEFLLQLDAVKVIIIWKWPGSWGDQSYVPCPMLAVCMCVRIRKPIQWALSQIGVAWNIPEVIAKGTDSSSSFRNCLWC